MNRRSKNFPLVDGFFFVDSNPKTLVGLRMTTAGEHHTTTSTVRQFTECLAAYFNGWKKLSRDMSWDIINVQHADSTPMNDWQRCDVVDSDNVSRAETERLRRSGRKRCASTKCQYHPETFEEKKLSEVGNNHRNRRKNWGKGQFLISGKEILWGVIYFWILFCVHTVRVHQPHAAAPKTNAQK
ncbi:putative retrotransposon hot spot protein (RHS) [Trypanosoma cruzi]|uniref:Putative retrotransposon hot spot protein (RHS) n=1 Tax=Trypanosoma cruzi TaxID=5693 RepID=A0A2V2WJP2_TRYCR|nr:putative retrotransposon hot spot protein (RHS) [Trypanosoma cruzi]